MGTNQRSVGKVVRFPMASPHLHWRPVGVRLQQADRIVERARAACGPLALPVIAGAAPDGSVDIFTLPRGPVLVSPDHREGRGPVLLVTWQHSSAE